MDNDFNKPSLQIKRLIFNDGTKLDLKGNDIVLFVGPNNVGKSKTLKEINDSIYDNDNRKVLLKDITYMETNFNKENIFSYVKNNLLKDKNGNYYVRIDDHTIHPFTDMDYRRIDNSGSNNKEFYKIFTSFLSTEDRLMYSSPKSRTVKQP